MIDFRYHLVSLISVFLALAVGIVLGAGPLRENLGDQLAGESGGGGAQGRDALGHFVGEAANNLSLGVQHLVDGDEVRAHDVPVHVLKHQLEIIQGVQSALQQAGDLVAVVLT